MAGSAAQGSAAAANAQMAIRVMQSLRRSFIARPFDEDRIAETRVRSNTQWFQATRDSAYKRPEDMLDIQIGRSYSQASIYRSSTMPKRKLDPLPAAAFQILLSLADEDLHGYGIMRQVEQQTNGRMRLGPGTLYSSIQALVEEKLIEEVDRKADAVGDSERRRYYRLTLSGRKLARVEAERLADLLRVARAKKILRGEYV